MRFKKIRGHSKIQKNIQKWIDSNCTLDLEALLEFNYQYVQINILPWMNKPLVGSRLLEPNGFTKNMLLDGLGIIYDNWKSQLEKLDQPYYLKIWLNEPRLTKSEVVCGIKEKIEEFENSFYKINLEENKSYLINQLSSDFKWECAIDEDLVFERDVSSPENYINIEEYYSDKKLLNKAKKKGFRNKAIENSLGEKDVLYFIPKGKIWIGEK